MDGLAGLGSRRFTLPAVPARFGCGSVDDLDDVLSGLSCSRPLLVTDRGVVRAGLLSPIIRVLESMPARYEIFDGVNPNPSTDTLEAGASAARDFRPDAIVAIGGGSVIDSAKGIALMAVNDGPAGAFDYRNEPERPGIPIVAVPTTAGTGAETNSFGVIDDHLAGRKFYVGHRSTVPSAVILDPELTRNLPRAQTASTGMDVLTHALESVSSRSSNPYADGINLQVAAIVFRYLPRATDHGDDIEARSQLLLAAHMAGLAFSTTGLGMAHGLAHALSARIGAPHGVVLSVLLAHVLTFNLPVGEQTFRRVVDTVFPERTAQGASVLPEAVRELARGVGMPDSLSELGLDGGRIPQIAADALSDEVMANTPRLPTQSELETLLRDAL